MRSSGLPVDGKDLHAKAAVSSTLVDEIGLTRLILLRSTMEGNDPSRRIACQHDMAVQDRTGVSDTGSLKSSPSTSIV
jgi:hypothetical protein